MNKVKAYCWRSGLIEFGSKVPSGAIPIIDTHGKQISRESIESGARLGYDHSLLVPGIPEADSDEAAMEALEKWIEWLSDPRAYNLKQQMEATK
jgi:hypothetical protein